MDGDSRPGLLLIRDFYGKLIPFSRASLRWRRQKPATIIQDSPRSADIAAWIVGVRIAPFLHQRLEFGVVAVGQHDSSRDEEIARCASPLRQTLPLQAKNPPARGVLGDREVDRAAERRHADLAVELLAGRQAHAFLRAVDRFLERHGHGDVEVEIEADAAGVVFERTAAALPRATLRAAEHAVEDVLKAARAGESAGPARVAAAESVVLEAARTGAPAGATRPTARKTLEARLAFGVDFAAIESLALFLV